MSALAAPWPAAAAVSGGGDSVALMHLLVAWAQAEKQPPPLILNLDHGLQPESHKYSERVRKLAREQGLAAHVLTWKGPKPSSDIEAEARTARYRLMGEWCRANGIVNLYLAHNLEDQAETFLLRLARGTGLDGLAAMAPVSTLPVPEFAQIKVVRPLLEFRRADLRRFLEARRLAWLDDPMNTDARFARNRLRTAWPQLESVGLTPARIADAARHLARARSALDEMTAGFLQRGVRFVSGQALLDLLRLKILPREIGLRALAAVLSRVSGEEYRPRFDSLERLFDSAVGETLAGGATLHGCKIAPAKASDQVFGTGTLTISREPARKGKEPAGSRARKD